MGTIYTHPQNIEEFAKQLNMPNPTPHQPGRTFEEWLVLDKVAFCAKAKGNTDAYHKMCDDFQLNKVSEPCLRIMNGQGTYEHQLKTCENLYNLIHETRENLYNLIRETQTKKS